MMTQRKRKTLIKRGNYYLNTLNINLADIYHSSFNVGYK